ncbi:MAG: hypothetical protein CL524_05840 [Aequorivita sp.]|nr:hypothetical protein [Aequorivita sp.]
MPVYSFPAAAIVDSTATGRSLVTAADAAAVRTAAGVDLTDFEATNGTFTSSLETNAGAVLKFFNATGTNAEYVQGAWIANDFYFGTKKDGAGSARAMYFQYDSSNRLLLDSSEIKFYRNLLPSTNGTLNIGSASLKVGAVTAVSFAGDGSALTGLPSGSSTLSGLTDTNVSSPASGQLLIYDAVSSKWDNAALTSSDASVTITVGAGTIDLATGGVGPSDERLKKNIQPIKESLKKVMAMEPVNFEWREGYDEFHKAEGSDIGFVAQQIEQVEPLLVGEREQYLTLDYAKFAPILVGAIQELKAEIERLKKKVGEE